MKNHSRSKLEMREPRHLLHYINVQPGASPSRLTLQTLSELFISNWASDLAALSIPELKIVWGAARATLSPITIFSSAELSVGVTSQIVMLWTPDSGIYNSLVANTAKTILGLSCKMSRCSFRRAIAPVVLCVLCQANAACLNSEREIIVYSGNLTVRTTFSFLFQL